MVMPLTWANRECEYTKGVPLSTIQTSADIGSEVIQLLIQPAIDTFT